MNKYTAVGLAQEAYRGSTVLVVTHDQNASRHALKYFEDSPDVVRICSTRGQEEVHYRLGGRILFRSWRSHGDRGVDADIVFTDAGVDMELGIQKLRDLLECVRASGGELISGSM